MADEHNQRPPFRASDSITRVSPTKQAGMGPGAPAGSDPLAELARLIGQSDPFSEYGRDSARTPAAPMAPPIQQPGRQLSQPPMPEALPFDPPEFVRQSFGSPSLAAGHDLYQVEGEPPRYAEPQAGDFAGEHAGEHAGAPAGDFGDDPYHPGNAQFGPGEGDYYEDAPLSRRRMGIMVIAGVFALAVIGTAGAFGYRALFHPSGPSAPPPVIKAESAPSKIVPASNKDAQSKQITDRINAPSQGEKLVSREEKPVEIKDMQPGAVFPPEQGQANPMVPAPGSGVVSPDAKRVRTIAIRPDQATFDDSTPTVASSATPIPPPRVTANPPARQAAAPLAPQQQTPPARVADTAPPAVVQETVAPPARRQPVQISPVMTQQHAAAPAHSNAPLSLSPDAPAPARVAPTRSATPAARTASVAPRQIAPAANGGGYAVQVSSQRSEADAQAAFRNQQNKYPDLLGGKQPLIHRVDLGAKGIYYRVMIGPFASGGEASQLCSSLKAAGGQCIIQRN